MNARITARDEQTGAWASAKTDADGRFKFGVEAPGDGIPAGNYQVVLIEDRGDWDHPNPRRIHTKYGNPSTSGLELKVEAGETRTLDVDLDPPGAPR